ncbi:MAG: CPBP family intramembrane metalloprotease [Bacteroides sp.]|nr:CPBP family intramembrane metalloprotease [Bacteroides sp.]
MNLSLTFGRRLWLLVLLFVLGGVLALLFQKLIMALPVDAQASLRISMVFQQLLMFLLPAVGCAVMVTRRPAELLQIKSLPSVQMFGLALLTFLVSIPAMNCIIEAFENLPWPAEIVMAEDVAKSTIEGLMGQGVVSAILSCCILAVLPGLCEELFFRGALQNLLRSRPMSVHLAVWIAAIIFSLIHFQPIGFVPRMLLGAGFGYFAVWTGSLWTAIACHMVNNFISVMAMQTGVDPDIVGLSTPVVSIVSVVLTVVGLRMIYSRFMSRGM